MKKFEKNIYKCAGFWSWMQEMGFSQNGHFLTENLNRRPDYYVVPTYHMLIGYLMDYVVVKDMVMPVADGAKNFYDRLIETILDYEEKNYKKLLATAVNIGGYKVIPQPIVSRGDKVLVKPIEWYEKSCQRRGSRADNFECNGDNFTKEMSRFCGELLTVSNASNDGQRFEVMDDGACGWNWTTGMIEGVIVE